MISCCGTGKTFERPDLSAFLDYARSGDALAVIRLDRPGRSLKELLKTVENLKGREINLISLEERIDTTFAAGELLFHVFGAIAQFERRLISQRTKDGPATARMHGRSSGRPLLQPETISALQDLVEAGKSVSPVAEHLGIGRSRPSVKRARDKYSRIVPRSVDNYRAAMRVAVRYRLAAQLVSVLSYLVAIPLNSLINWVVTTMSKILTTRHLAVVP